MNRPPIVLLHGANSAAVEMEPLAEVLRAYGVVHAPNLVGHGGRDIPAALSLPEMAADAIGWMGRQGLSRAVVVHVVHPGVWPGVQTARSVVAPSVTVSPSRSTRTTFTGSQPSHAIGEMSVPASSALASSAMAMSCAPVTLFM